jgi:tetratricopeptide (TPR) repeat protein
MKPATSLRNIVAQADRLYSLRADSRNVEESVEMLEHGQSDSFEVAWRLARAKFFLGQESESPKAAGTFHLDGIVAGRLAVRERRERVEGHFWTGVNLAMLAQHESLVLAIVHALQAKRSLRRAIEIDAAYHSAGPLRVLARLQHKLPRIVGGGPQMARENYRKAISIAPNNTVTRIYFAELLLELSEEAQAQRELEAVLRITADSDWAHETARDKELAKKMMVGQVKS